MIWAIIPVKSLKKTKSRLSTILSPQERKALTIRLLGQEIKVLSELTMIENVLIVSRDEAVLQHAHDYGCEVLVEKADLGLNNALTEARGSLANVATDLLILPSDLPYISAESLEAIIVEQSDAVICGDRHGSGTNALLIPARSKFEFQFGMNSFQKHQKAMAQEQIPFQTLALPEIEFDLDTPADWQTWQQTQILLCN